MTEKKLYTCDICKTDYANKADAQKCEKEHCKCAGITDFRIHAHQKYPNKIEVAFSDGTKHWYRQQLGELNQDLAIKALRNQSVLDELLGQGLKIISYNGDISDFDKYFEK